MEKLPLIKTLSLCIALVGQLDPLTANLIDTSYSFHRVGLEDGLSQRSISVLLSDRDGFLWIGTEDGLNRYDGYDFEIYRPDPNGKEGLSNGWITALCEDGDGNLWMGTRNGLNYYDRRKGSVTRILPHNDDGPGLSNEEITGLAIDSSGQLWIGTKKGLNRLESSAHRMGQDSIPAELTKTQIRALCFDHHNRLWTATDSYLTVIDRGGRVLKRLAINRDTGLLAPPVDALLRGSKERIWIGSALGIYAVDAGTFGVKSYVLDPEDIDAVHSIFEDSRGKVWVGKKNLYEITITEEGYTYQQFREDPQDPNTVSTGSMVKSIATDIAGNIWIGAWAGGLTRISRRKSHFFNIETEPVIGNQPYPPVTATLIDREGQIWIGTWGRGAGRWNRDNQTFRAFRASDDPPTIHSDIVTCVIETADGKIWMTTAGSGLSCYDPATSTFHQYQADADDPFSISSDVLNHVFEDSRGNLWVCNRVNGLDLMDRKKGNFQSFKSDPNDPESISDDRARALVEDLMGILWLGTLGGGLNRIDPDTYQFSHFRHDPADPLSLTGDMVTDVFCDHIGQVWVGTSSGLNKMDPADPGRFVRFTTADGLPNNVILAIEEDSIGRLWLSTNDGISCLHPERLLFVNYSTEDGLLDREYNGMVSDRSPKTGELIFGSIRSATLFQPMDFEVDTQWYPIILTALSSLGNNEETIQPTTYPPSTWEHDHFYHEDRIISFKISSLAYTDNNHIQYQYHLEGFSNHWYPLDRRREIIFTNLDPGSYLLHARATNSDGIWSPSQHVISFNVHPPWYRSPIAVLLYILLASGTAIILYRFQKRRWQLRTQLQLEKAEAGRLKELDKQKNNLFANITHEFRTPLTLILGLTRQLKLSATGKVDRHLDVIQRNGQQLLSLVNQMLDLTKIESGNRTPAMVNADVMAYIGYLVESYQSLAIAQRKSLTSFCTPKQFVMDYDPSMLHQILENLISNTLKFSAEYGQTKVIAYIEGQEFCLEVDDNGMGIEPDQLPHIFDRFFQADDTSTRKTGGTGIGLALVKELVDLLNGKITVESEPGSGTSFHLSLPISNKADTLSESKDQIVQRIRESSLLLAQEASMPGTEEAPSNTFGQDDRPILLIIEDNQDVINYLKTCLRHDYIYLVAREGRSGVDLALEHIPDIIITDLMMPLMDGFQVCEVLRADRKTSHIPIIMLTAKATVEDRLKGLAKGADAYLSKPFHEEELLIRIERLIHSRKDMQRKIREEEADVPDTEVVFLSEINQILARNLEDENFDVMMLCHNLGMSRSQLHRKLKAITNCSAGQYIRLFRLNHAKQLLETTDLNISEVAYRVGFKHPGNFSVAFKNEFGASPSEI